MYSELTVNIYQFFWVAFSALEEYWVIHKKDVQYHLISSALHCQFWQLISGCHDKKNNASEKYLSQTIHQVFPTTYNCLIYSVIEVRKKVAITHIWFHFSYNPSSYSNNTPPKKSGPTENKKECRSKNTDPRTSSENMKFYFLSAVILD